MSLFYKNKNEYINERKKALTNYDEAYQEAEYEEQKGNFIKASELFYNAGLALQQFLYKHNTKGKTPLPENEVQELRKKKQMACNKARELEKGASTQEASVRQKFNNLAL